MSHKNYKNYSAASSKKPAPVVADEIEMSMPEAVIDDTVEIAEAVENIESTPAPVFGIVVDCTKLNIRKVPSKNGAVVNTVNAGTKMEIDQKASTVEWYKVYNESGLEGFCMKKFIKIL